MHKDSLEQERKSVNGLVVTAIPWAGVLAVASHVLFAFYVK